MEIIQFTNELKIRGFNMSSVCSIYNPMERFTDYVSTKEVVHSQIIAELLNPTGEHQLGYGVLSELLDKVGLKNEAAAMPYATNPITDLIIQTEYSAPTTLDGEFHDGRIDIFVRFNYNNKYYAIIIENKLNDAPDQPRQLERYNNFVKEKFGKDIIRKTVYMPRIGNTCEEYPDAIVINATHLSEMIEHALNKSISPSKNVIRAYSYYLKNISINNINMDNAKILAEMTSEDISNAKAIKEAYDKLPEAFAEKLHKNYRGEVYKTQIWGTTREYCFIWNEESYRQTGFWLAVCFGYDGYWIYVVSNNTNRDCLSVYSDQLKIISLDKPYANWRWFRPVNEKEFHIKFNGRPDWNELDQRINKWIDQLHKCANMSTSK